MTSKTSALLQLSMLFAGNSDSSAKKLRKIVLVLSIYIVLKMFLDLNSCCTNFATARYYVGSKPVAFRFSHQGIF